MKIDIPHVSKRGKMFQYSRRVPTSVMSCPKAFERVFGSKQLFRKSLHTSNEDEAILRAKQIGREFDARVFRALNSKGPDVVPFATLPSKFTAKALAEIARSTMDEEIKYWRKRIIRANVDPLAREALQVSFEKEAEKRQCDDEYHPDKKAVELADIQNERMGFGLAQSSAEFGELIQAVKDGLVEADIQIGNLVDGKSLPDKPSSTLISDFTESESDDIKYPLFSEVCEIQRSKRAFKSKTIKKGKRAQKLFLETVGDIKVNRIDRTHVFKFLNKLSKQTVGKSGVPVSGTTVRSYLTQISSPLSFAISRGWHGGPNPACGLNVRDWVDESQSDKIPDKRRFHNDELKAVFNYPWFTGCRSNHHNYEKGSLLLNDSRYWVPVIAAYTGARASELGGLLVEEVKFEDYPHIVFQPNEYRGTKSKTARKVPILDVLFELGFEEYHERIVSTGSDRLFPDWTAKKDPDAENEWDWANGKWIRAFNRTLIRRTFPWIKDVKRSPITFHSLRGAFKKLLYDAGSYNKANAIIGHSLNDLDKRYIGDYDIQELYKEFRAARFDGLVIRGRKD